MQGYQFGKDCVRNLVKSNIVFLLSSLAHELGYFLLFFDQNCRVFFEKSYVIVFLTPFIFCVSMYNMENLNQRNITNLQGHQKPEGLQRTEVS